MAIVIDRFEVVPETAPPPGQTPAAGASDDAAPSSEPQTLTELRRTLELERARLQRVRAY